MHEEALEIFGRYLDQARSDDDLMEIMRFSVLLANALTDCELFGRAEEVLAAAIGRAREVVDPKLRANLYWTQCRLHSSKDQPDLAAKYARMVVSILDDTEHTADAARALLLLAHIENDRGNAVEVVELVGEGLPVLEALGQPAETGLFRLEHARALLALGEREEAAAVALGAIPLFDGVRPQSAARGYALAAGVFDQLGDTERAIELFELAAEAFVIRDRHATEVSRNLAELYEQAGRSDDALRVLKQALGGAGTRGQADDSRTSAVRRKR